MDERPSNVVEELTRDAVAEIRRRNVLPRPNDVRRFIEPIVMEVERRNEDDRLRVKPAPNAPTDTKQRSTADMESEYQKRCRRFGLEATPGSWSVERSPAKPEKTKLELDNARTALMKRRLRARLRLLRSKPEWAARFRRINPLALQGQLGREKALEAEEMVKRIIRDSNETWGHWMRGKSKKIYSYG